VAEFLNRIMRPEDRAFLVTAATRTTLLTDLTNSVAELRKGTERIQPAMYWDEPQAGQQLGESCPTKMDGKKVVSRCGGSAIWDAAYAASRMKLRALQGTKALIILSDGLDTGSIHNLDRTIEEVQVSSTIVYAIKLGDVRALFTRGLSKLAGETGGEQIRPKGNDFAEIFRHIESDLRTRYVLGFRSDRSTAREGSHQLRVETIRPGADVRARAGYYQTAAGKWLDLAAIPARPLVASGAQRLTPEQWRSEPLLLAAEPIRFESIVGCCPRPNSQAAIRTTHRSDLAQSGAPVLAWACVQRLPGA
jgi:VWFA-related protein